MSKHSNHFKFGSARTQIIIKESHANIHYTGVVMISQSFYDANSAIHYPEKLFAQSSNSCHVQKSCCLPRPLTKPLTSPRIKCYRLNGMNGIWRCKEPLTGIAKCC